MHTTSLSRSKTKVEETQFKTIFQRKTPQLRASFFCGYTPPWRPHLQRPFRLNCFQKRASCATVLLSKFCPYISGRNSSPVASPLPLQARVKSGLHFWWRQLSPTKKISKKLSWRTLRLTFWLHNTWLLLFSKFYSLDWSNKFLVGGKWYLMAMDRYYRTGIPVRSRGGKLQRLANMKWIFRGQTEVFGIVRWNGTILFDECQRIGRPNPWSSFLHFGLILVYSPKHPLYRPGPQASKPAERIFRKSLIDLKCKVRKELMLQWLKKILWCM